MAATTNKPPQTSKKIRKSHDSIKFQAKRTPPLQNSAQFTPNSLSGTSLSPPKSIVWLVKTNARRCHQARPSLVSCFSWASGVVQLPPNCRHCSGECTVPQMTCRWCRYPWTNWDKSTAVEEEVVVGFGDFRGFTMDVWMVDGLHVPLDPQDWFKQH